MISVIVPAYNEEKYIGRTINSIKRAQDLLLNQRGIPSEIIVVDNDSTDRTVNIARSCEVRVLSEPTHNVAKVRNVGATQASGDILVFIDADVMVPERLLCRIDDTISSELCLGGSIDVSYQPIKYSVKLYLQLWRFVGKLAGMAQGATQFCRRDVFVSLKGFDERLFMGEDVDFYWRMTRAAKRSGGRVCLIDDVQVTASTRRFDQWSLWRTLIWTNPVFVLLFRRRKTIWRGWYSRVPR